EVQVARDVEMEPMALEDLEVRAFGGGELEVDGPLRMRHAPDVPEGGPRVVEVLQAVVHRDLVEVTVREVGQLGRSGVDGDAVRLRLPGGVGVHLHPEELGPAV